MIRVAMAAAMVAAGAMIGGASPGVAAPPCQPLTFYDGVSFNYVRCQIPDVDQRRSPDPPFTPGLPGGGGMYCVPTSALNFMAYLANQGFPTVAPGPGDWGPEPGFPPFAQYNAMTTAISLMGGLMGTDATNGTGDGSPGIKKWLAGAGVGEQFTASLFYATGNYSPTIWDLGVAAVNGGLIMPIVGRYKPAKDLPQEIKDELEAAGQELVGLWRVGGHIMSMALARSADGVIGVRDPARPNNGAVFDQATFTTDEYEVDDTLAKFDGKQRTQSKIVDLGTSGYLDGYFEIKPKYGMVSDKASITFLHPIQLIGSDVPDEERITSYSTPSGGDVIDVALRTGSGTHPYVVQGENAIWQIDARTGNSTRFASVGNPRRIALGGPEQWLYALLPNHVVALDRGGRQVARTQLPVELADIAYDELRDQLVGTTEDGRSLVVFDPSLKEGETWSLIGSIPDNACLDDLHSDPATGVLWLLCEPLAQLIRVTLRSGRTAETAMVELQGAEHPTGLSVDDEGHLFVTDHGVVVEYDEQGRRVESSLFRGLPGGTSLEISRSFSNFDPETMSGPRYRNVLPEDFDRG